MIKFTIQVDGDEFVFTQSSAIGDNPTPDEFRVLLDSFKDGSAKCELKIALKKLCTDRNLDAGELLRE